MVSIRRAFRPHVQERPARLHRMIVPVSGGPADARLLEVVAKIASNKPVCVTIVFVVEVEQSMPLDAELPEEIERGERVLGDAELVMRRCVPEKLGQIQTELLQARTAGAAIVDESIDRVADVIMITTTLRKIHGKITVGETVKYVLEHAPCEVMVIREAMPDWQAEMLEH